MDLAHLIPKQRIKRELRDLPPEQLRAVVWDQRVVVPMCRTHHHQFDNYIHRLTRRELPPELLAYAREHRLMWSVIRDYR